MSAAAQQKNRMKLMLARTDTGLLIQALIDSTLSTPLQEGARIG